MIEWLIINQNAIGATLVVLSVVVSRFKLQLPIIILCYYLLFYLVVTKISVWNGEIKIFKTDSPELLYLTYCSIDATVILMCWLSYLSTKSKLTLCYGVVVFFYMTCDALQGIMSFTHYEDDTVRYYVFIQQFAVIFDVLFAWLGSANAVVRRVHYHAMRTICAFSRYRNFRIKANEEKPRL